MTWLNLWILATLDIYSRRGIRTTWAIIASLACVTFVAVLLFGLVLGQERVLQHRIANQPLAKSLWVGNPVETRDRISKLTLSKLDEVLKRLPALDEKVIQVFPFRVLQYEFGYENGTRGMPTSGRTIQIDAAVEPLFQELQFSAEQQASMEAAEYRGIIVTSRLMERLHLSHDAKELNWFNKQQLRWEKVPILAVTGIELPYELEFLVTDSYDDQLSALVDSQRHEVAYSGPIPDNWLDDAGLLPEATSKFMEQQSVDASPIFRGEGYVLEALVSGNAEPLETSQWNALFAEVHRIMVEEVGHPSEEFLQLSIPGQEEQAIKVVERDFDMIAIYVHDLEDLSTVCNGCDEIPELTGYADRRIVEQLQAASRDHRTALAIVAALVAVMGFASAANLLVVQQLRTEKKTPEAGILKTMGFSSGQLFHFLLAQTILQWLPATFVGVVLACIAGTYFSARSYVTFQEQSLGFVFTSWLVFMIALSVFFVFMAIGMICAQHWIIRSPAKLIYS